MSTENPMFNPEMFLNTQVSEANATEYVVVPEGEYIAMCGPVSADSFKSYDIKKGERAGQKMYVLELVWDVNDEDKKLAELLGRPPKVRQRVNLDINSQGGLDFGKGRNVQLGRVREAMGQNATGRPWAFSMLGGQPAKIKVKHDIYEGKTNANVADVARLS